MLQFLVLEHISRNISVSKKNLYIVLALEKNWPKNFSQNMLKKVSTFFSKRQKPLRKLQSLIKETHCRYLVIYFFLNLFYWAISASNAFWSKSIVLDFLVNNFPIASLTAPFLYLFFREKLLEVDLFDSFDFWHFAPFAFFLLFEISALIDLQVELGDQELSLQPHYLGRRDSFFNIFDKGSYRVFRIGQIATYFSASLLLIIRKVYSSIAGQQRMSHWLPCMVVVFVSAMLYNFPSVYGNLIYFLDTNYNFFYALLVILAVLCCIYLFKIFLFHFLYNQKMMTIKSLLQDQHSVSNEFRREGRLSENGYLAFEKVLENYLKDRPTRDQHFNKVKFLQDLEVPEYFVNNYFNRYLGLSFNHWKTKLRIEDSRELILSGYLKNHTLEALSRHVGYTSRGRFVEAFIKWTGTHPSDFRTR